MPTFFAEDLDSGTLDHIAEHLADDAEAHAAAHEE